MKKRFYFLYEGEQPPQTETKSFIAFTFEEAIEMFKKEVGNTNLIIDVHSEPADKDLLKSLIDILNKQSPDYINGCVIMHFDKQTGDLKSISPMLPVMSIQDLYNKLLHGEKAIHQFLEDLINKDLVKRGQAN